MTSPRTTLALFLACLAATATLPATTRAQDDFAADAARAVAALELQPGQIVADIGAGGGQLTVELARVVGPSGHVYATELTEDRRGEIREAVEAAGLESVTVLEAHATRTNLPRQCCHALVLRRVYHHFDAPHRMNASMRESLRPGGLLAVIDFAPDSAESTDPGGRDTGDQHGVTAATVARELQASGFDVVAMEEGTGRGRFMVVARRPPE